MRTTILLGLAALTMAAPVAAHGEDARESSTYVPGPANGGASAPYSLHNSAVAPAGRARGGGPGSLAAEPSRAQTRGLHGPATVQSDNQTRRPGAANYTGASFGPSQKDGSHTVPGVSMQGDDFTAGRTGSATTGPIPVRAPSSNENGNDTRAVPAARGGGPAQPRTRMRMRTSPNEGAVEGTGVRRPGESSNRVVLPSGATETLAPAPELSVGVAKFRAARPTGFTAADFADLPRPGDGTAVHGGLLAMEPQVTDDQFIGQRMAGATPQRFQLGTHYPGTALGIGGGPSNAATEGFPERMLSGRVPLR